MFYFISGVIQHVDAYLAGGDVMDFSTAKTLPMKKIVRIVNVLNQNSGVKTVDALKDL